MNNQALTHLKTSGIDYRPFMGAKFFVDMFPSRKNMIKLTIWGYTSDELEDKKQCKFEDLVNNYYNKHLKNI